MLTMYHYPKCSTCQKAKQFLLAQGATLDEKHIVETPPTVVELRRLIERSGLAIEKWFNTSGIKYRELGLSKKLKEMEEAEKLTLLASDGMLIKRPIITDGEQVTVGFREKQAEVWKR